SRLVVPAPLEGRRRVRDRARREARPLCDREGRRNGGGAREGARSGEGSTDMSEFNSAALPETQLRYLPLSQVGDVSRLPTTVKVLLEGVLRAAARGAAAERDAVALAKYPAPPPADASLPFRPSRILLQDYTGVPAAVDLAAMRAAMERAGKDPAKIEPQIPVDLIIEIGRASCRERE